MRFDILSAALCPSCAAFAYTGRSVAEVAAQERPGQTGRGRQLCLAIPPAYCNRSRARLPLRVQKSHSLGWVNLLHKTDAFGPSLVHNLVICPGRYRHVSFVVRYFLECNTVIACAFVSNPSGTCLYSERRCHLCRISVPITVSNSAQ